MADVAGVVDKSPNELRPKAERLKSLDEFELPYWKGLLFHPWIIGLGFAAVVAISILLFG